PTNTYTLSLHDALPISQQRAREGDGRHEEQTDSQETRKTSQACSRLPEFTRTSRMDDSRCAAGHSAGFASAGSARRGAQIRRNRSEEHTSELQSLAYLV